MTSARSIAVMVLASLSSLGVCACDGSGPLRLSGAERGKSVVGGSVVSTVDGHPIELSEVEALASSSGLQPREALRRLQAERLLMAEAERRGYADREIEEVTARAFVQTLLEREAAKVEVTAAEIAHAYEGDQRFRAPERRTAAHVLVRLPKDVTPAEEADAYEIARLAIADFRAEPAEGFVLARFRKLKHPRFTLKGERIPPIAREGRLVREFEDALFSLPEAGIVPEPVRTMYGVHAIKVTKVEPAVDIDLAGATPVLREELLTQKRSERVEALLQAFRKRYGVELDGPSASAHLATLP